MDVTKMPWGPDVNAYHPVKDWQALAGSGATFFGAKATEGATFVDKSFVAHRDGFRQHCSSFTMAIWYHFFRADRDPVTQAEHLAETVGRLGPRERLCCDFEGKSYATVDQATIRRHGIRMLESFYGRLASLGVMGGSWPVIYTSDQHWRAIGNPDWGRAAGIDLWVPRYHLPDPKAPDRLPLPWKKWTILQYTDGDSGIHRDVPGVGLCDCNVLAP
jgi:lysozyme